MARCLIEVAALQPLLIVPTAAYYVSLVPTKAAILPIAYVPPMIGLWVFWVCATFVVAARLVRQRQSLSTGIQQPLVSLAGDGADADISVLEH